MKAPVVALKQPGNHGPHAGSICKKICPQRPQPGKYDYFAQPESYSRSGAWEFFTEDYTRSFARRRGKDRPAVARRALTTQCREVGDGVLQGKLAGSRAPSQIVHHTVA